MASIPLPALDIRSQQPSPLQTYATLQQIIGQQQDQQLRAQQIQQGQLQLQDQRAMSAAMKQWDGQDPADLPGLILKNGGSANAVFGARNQILEYQTGLANKTKLELANEATRNDVIAGHIDEVKSLPVDQQPQAFEAAKADLVNRGYLDPQKAQSFQYQGPDQLDALEKVYVAHSAQVSDALKAAQTGEALGKGALAATQAQMNQIKLRLANAKPGDFDQQIDSVIPATQFGQLNAATKAMVNSSLQRGDVDSARQALDRAFGTVSDIAKETNPQVAQARAQQAATTASIVEPLRQQILVQFQNNKDARDKIEATVLKPYQDKMSEIAELNATLDQAAGGNVASARAALLKMMGVSNPDGTKRYNAQEAARMVSMGSIPQRIQGTIQNALTGNEWTPQMVSDMRAFAQGQAGAAQQSLNGGIDNVNKLYGTNVGGGLKQGVLPDGGGKLIDKATAMQFYKAAGNDPNKARQLALQNHWKVQ